MDNLKNIHISFAPYAIEIHYAQDQVYYVYNNGGDLNDLDEFIAYLCPTTNFAKIDTNIALELEKHLCYLLKPCKRQSSGQKALKSFIDYIVARTGTSTRTSETKPLERSSVNARMYWHFRDWNFSALPS